MEIGIIGKGKMGMEIFNHIMLYDYRLNIVCRKEDDVEPLKASTDKLLRKLARRGYLSEEALSKKRTAYHVTSDIRDLKNCDVVIESITEDFLSKQNIFTMLETIVRPDCILATNTSSIPLKLIFEKCFNKDRCLGIHFFYPVKLTQIVEINKMSQTDVGYINSARDFLLAIQKKPVELDEHNNMIVNKILLTMIAQMYRFYEDGVLTIDELDAVMKDKILTFGLFEIVDATGLELILRSVENFMDNRHRKLYTDFYLTGKNMLQAGYGGGPTGKRVTDYNKDHPIKSDSSDAEKNAYKDEILLILQSLLINEIAYLGHSQHIELDSISYGIKEVLGLNDDVMSLLASIGLDSVVTVLTRMWIEKEDEIYKPEDLNIFKLPEKL